MTFYRRILDEQFVLENGLLKESANNHKELNQKVLNKIKANSKD